MQKKSDSDLFSRDAEKWDKESIEEAKLRITRIVEKNRALRARLAEAPTTKKKPSQEDLL